MIWQSVVYIQFMLIVMCRLVIEKGETTGIDTCIIVLFACCLCVCVISSREQDIIILYIQADDDNFNTWL